MTRRRGRPRPKGGERKLRSEKLQAEFSFAMLGAQPWVGQSVLQGAPPTGPQIYVTFPSAPDPLIQSVKSTLSDLKRHRLSRGILFYRVSAILGPLPGPAGS